MSVKIPVTHNPLPSAGPGIGFEMTGQSITYIELIYVMNSDTRSTAYSLKPSAIRS